MKDQLTIFVEGDESYRAAMVNKLTNHIIHYSRMPLIVDPDVGETVRPRAGHSVRPRAIASGLYRSIAQRIERPGALIMGNTWLSVPYLHPMTSLQRMLERAALTIGVVAVVQSLELVGPHLGRVPVLLADPAEGAELLLARVHAARWAAPSIAPGAGAWRPGHVALLVAERPGSAAQWSLKHRLPYFNFEVDGVSGWLADGLESIGVNECDLYWVNAFDSRNNRTDSSFVEELRPSVVFALGPRAERWVGQVFKPGTGARTQQIIIEDSPVHYWGHHRFDDTKKYGVFDRQHYPALS